MPFKPEAFNTSIILIFYRRAFAVGASVFAWGVFAWGICLGVSAYFCVFLVARDNAAKVAKNRQLNGSESI